MLAEISMSLAAVLGAGGIASAPEPPSEPLTAVEVAAFLTRAVGDRIVPQDESQSLRFDDPTGDTFPYLGDGAPAQTWTDMVGGGGYQIAGDDPGLRELLDTAILPLCTQGDLGAVCPPGWDAAAFDNGISVFWAELPAPVEPPGDGVLAFVGVTGSDGVSPELDLGALQRRNPFNSANCFYNYDVGARTLQYLRYDGAFEEPGTSAIVLPADDTVVIVIPNDELQMADWDVSTAVVSGASAATADLLRPDGSARFPLPVAELTIVTDTPIVEAPTTDPTATEPTATEPSATEPASTDEPDSTDAAPGTTAPTDTDDTTAAGNGDEPTATTAADGDQGADDDDGDGFGWIVVVIALVAAVGIGAIVVGVTRRRSRPAPPEPPAPSPPTA